MKAIASVVLLALAGAGAIYFLTRGDDGSQPTTVVDVDNGSPEVPPQVADAMQAAEKMEMPKKRELPRKNRVYFPDGSYLPALNGAINPRAVEFRHRPWAPVIAKRRDSSGRQWYEHEDGSFSTTFMGWRKDLGRMDPITQVAHPTEPKPLLLDEVVGPGGIAPPVKNAGESKSGSAGKK